MSQIYDNLGSNAQCGRCAHTIKRIMEEIPNPKFAKQTRGSEVRTAGSEH
jgi:bacterioferritin-associated ferredoxin